jgi:hypothetical protein
MKFDARRCAWLLMTVLAAAPSVRAQSLPEAGRTLLRKYERSLWTIEVQNSLSISMNGQTGKTEVKVSTQGVLIDVGNLIAIPLSAVEPMNMMRATNPQMQNVNIEGQEVVEVKLLVPEGGELPATVVFKDNDLDLAFLSLKGAMPSNAVPLRLVDAGKPEVLDTAIVLARMENVGRNDMLVNAGYVQAILDKPQRAYLFEQATLATVGCPVFLPSGKLVGIVLVRYSTKVQSDGREAVTALAVVLPTETIRTAALQAEAAAKKTAAPAK